MQGIFRRNSLAVGALAAAGFFVMQLRTSGVEGYELSDILSILLIAVPIAVRSMRATPPRRASDAAAPSTPDDASAADGQPSADARAPDDLSGLEPRDGLKESDRTADGDHSPVPGGTDDAVRAVEVLLVRVVVVVVAVATWLAGVVLVLLQAWAPALGALIVFVLATVAFPSLHVDEPVAGATPSRR